jgi:CBS domain-containing membrane protein
MNDLRSWLRGFIPESLTVNKTEQLRSSIGALTGIFFTGTLTYYLCGPAAAQWLIAPIGASAVLLFAVPSSPLAQPWSIIGGNLISACVGVTCAMLINDLTVAAAMAIGLSVAAMFVLRCLHPPSGAVALTAVFGGPMIESMGYGFVLFPVGLNSILLLLIALLYNNITRRPYPHPLSKPVESHNTSDIPITERFGFTLDDLNDVLKEYNQVVAVSRDDLQKLFMQTEMHVYRRKLGEITCADIMSRDVVTVEFGTLIEDAWTQLRTHHIKALPVIDRAKRVIGIVTQIDFMKEADLDVYENFDQKLRRFIRRTRDRYSNKSEVVGQIMTEKVITAYEDMHIIGLIPLISESGVHHIPILNAENRLVGVVTQSDFIAALYRQL